MQSNTAHKWRFLLLTSLFAGFAGVIFQMIAENRLDYHSVMMGFPIGLVFGLLELFLFPRTSNRFSQWSFTRLLLFKTVLYTGVIFVVAAIVIMFVGLTEENRDWNGYFRAVFSFGQLVLVIYGLVVYGLLIFLMQVNRLLGEGVLWKFITGKYHRPREEERIFMFLDMKSSTTIAEKLGHVRFYALLNELFHEISQPVLQTRAEIYQYVGDEVVLTWELEEGLQNSNCLQTFFLFRDTLARNSDHYLKDFGVRPEFKAGLHFGKVISAQIGDLKREIVYNGDVLNTTARIQNECNRYGCDLLVSGALLEQLQPPDRFHCEKMDAVTLRGKETEVELFSVSNVPVKASHHLAPL